MKILLIAPVIRLFYKVIRKAFAPKKFISIIFLWTISWQAFCSTIVLENKTPYPIATKAGSIAVQWATTTLATQQANQALLNNENPLKESLTPLTQQGSISLNYPANAHFFRIVVWSNASNKPELLTNWVSITPNKTYVLNSDQLVPAALLAGSGC